MGLSLAERTTLVVGMARSGLAAAEFLRRRGAHVFVSEARQASDLKAESSQLANQGIQFETGGHSIEPFRQADLIVVSPGVPLNIPPLRAARKLGKEIISEIELASRFLQGRVIAVTGTNGKTTTTSLVKAVLKQAGFEVQVGGNIGTPLVSLVDSSSSHSWNVVEVSSFQLEAIPSFRPDISVILNITPDHMDRYSSFHQYVQAKLNIFQNQRPSDFVVLNADDPRLAQIAPEIRSRVCWFSTLTDVLPGTYADGRNVVVHFEDGPRVVLAQEEIPLRRRHNLENVVAAVTVGHLAGVELDSISEAVRSFRPVEHRLEPVRSINGVWFYNDSKATNIDATIKALEAFSSGVILILGGRDKGSDFRVLAPLVRERVKHLILIGEASRKISSQLAGSAPMFQASTMEHAVRLAMQQASGGDIVLLAPACASFDMFENYEHRGREFKAAVARLTEQPANIK